MQKKSSPTARNAKPFSAAAARQRLLTTLVCSDAHEQAARQRGAQLIAGVDEVGRGCLLGPVVAAAVILPEDLQPLSAAGLKDSKQIKEKERERLAELVRTLALAIHIAEVDAATIDRINIYQATRLAMRQAVEGLHCKPDHLLIDAMRLDVRYPQTSVIHGDALSLSIAAASVVAKVHRDAMMRVLDKEYPQYGLALHKGYGTARHKKALLEHGPCVLHRRSFAPVAACLR
ncbi:MAG: ribonuclease HII [Acidobacteriaceae bacterium]